MGVLLPEIIGDHEYVGFGDFIDVPHAKHFLHLLGVYKRSKVVCEQLANRLRHDYPEYYYRIIALFKNNKIALKKDHYYFLDKYGEDGLISRNEYLKTSYKNNRLSTCYKNGEKISSKTKKTGIKLFELLCDNDMIKENPHAYGEYLNDIKLFESKLASVLYDKFLGYSNDYLYGRDINHTHYFQFIFEDSKNVYNKTIVSDSIVEIIESKYDWSETDQEMKKSKFMAQLNTTASNVYTCVIPECDQVGYSLVNIDDLDIALLTLCSKPVAIGRLLDEIKSEFDPSDLENALPEFEMLILGRIKTGLQAKIIKAVSL